MKSHRYAADLLRTPQLTFTQLSYETTTFVSIEPASLIRTGSERSNIRMDWPRLRGVSSVNFHYTRCAMRQQRCQRDNTQTSYTSSRYHATDSAEYGVKLMMWPLCEMLFAGTSDGFKKRGCAPPAFFPTLYVSKQFICSGESLINNFASRKK